MNKKVVLTIILVFLFLFSALTTYIFLLYQRVVVEKPSVVLKAAINLTPTPTPDPMGPKNVLIMGYAGGDHEGAMLTDTIILAHIIPRERKIYLISIPRDIWVDVPVAENESKYFKVNAAYAIGYDDYRYPNKSSEFKGKSGGGNMAENVVGRITGMKIDNFVSVNFNGFRNIINILGGVELNVPYTFEDKFYPIAGLEKELCDKSDDELKAITATLSGQLLEQQFTCRYESIKFDKGKVVMDAETALKFVRSRHSETNGGDFGRSLRQQALIMAIKNKLLKMNSITKFISLTNEFSKNILTDINIADGMDLIKDNNVFSDVVIKTISLNTDNVLEEAVIDSQYVLTTKDGLDNWNMIKDYIQNEINKS